MDDDKQILFDNSLAGSALSYEPITPYQDSSFYSDVGASFDLSPLGQVILEYSGERNFLDEPPDVDLDIPALTEGYEEYATHFYSARNAKHVQYIKQKIDFNNYKRQQRDDGGLLPELAAAFLDPLMLIPIPVIRGVSIASRFAKGALATGTLVAAGEPIRHALDPTATWQESASYIGGAAIFGGTFGSILGRRTIDPSSSEQKLIDKMLMSQWDMENNKFTSKMFDDGETGLTYNVKIDDVGNLEEGIGYKLDHGAVVGKDKDGAKKYVMYKLKNDKRNKYSEDTILIDYDKALRDWKNGTWKKSSIVGAMDLPPNIKTVDDFLVFQMKKQYRKQILDEKLDGSPIDKENLINKEILNEMSAEQVSRSTAMRGKRTDKYASAIDRALTDLGALTNNKLRTNKVGNYIADIGVAIAGDHSVVMKAARAGFTADHSVNTKATLNNMMQIAAFNRRLHFAFQSHRKGNITQKKNAFLGYEPGSMGIRFKDKAIDPILEKLSLKEQTNDIKFDEFNNLVGKAMGDEDFAKTLSQPIQEFVKETRVAFNKIGKEMEDLNMFKSQKSVNKIRSKFLIRKEKAIQDLKKAEASGDTQLITRLKNQRDEASQQVNLMDDALEDLELGIEDQFNPMVDNYLNRIYDTDAIMENVRINDIDFLPPSVIDNPLVNSKGLAAGMVVRVRAGFTSEPMDVGSVVKASDRDNFGKVTKIEGDKITVRFEGEKGTATKVISKKDLQHVKSESAKNQFQYGKIIDPGDGENIKIKLNNQEISLSKKDYTLKSSRVDNIDKRFYTIPETGLRAKIYKHYIKNPKIFKHQDENGKVIQTAEPDDVYQLNQRVQETIDNMIGDGQNVNMDGDLGVGVMDNRITTGQSYLMSRTLNMTDAELDGFLIRDINFLFRTYSDRTSKRIEMTRRFGDQQMKTSLWDARQKMLVDDYKPGSNNFAEIDAINNRLSGMRDKLYGVYNTGDPSSFFKARLPHALRNWGSTTMMGKVYLSSLVDVARMPMVHGWQNTFRVLNAKNPFNPHSKEINMQIKEMKWLADSYDVVMNNAAAQRVVGITESRVGSGTTMFGRAFDKYIGSPLDNVQGPFYHANLLSPHTQLMKEWTATISAHRFIEDSVKVAKGIATDAEIKRLFTYGIDLKTARQIGKMPTHQTKNGLHYIKQNEWMKNKQGARLAKKLQYSIFDDVQRTIITPSIADKPNMMFGVIQMNTDATAQLFDNKFGKFFLGFEKQEVGGKLNNGFLALPLQFFAWSFAANRKLMLSGLSEREARVVSGSLALIVFGMLGDYLKNPAYYEHKTMQERIYRGVEMSGVLGLVGDANFILETVSEGMFETPLGIRPSIGTGGRFGKANKFDAGGEFVGPAPGLFLNTLGVFMQDTPYDEKSENIKRMVPGNNMLWWNGVFKSLWNTGAEVFK